MPLPLALASPTLDSQNLLAGRSPEQTRQGWHGFAGGEAVSYRCGPDSTAAISINLPQPGAAYSTGTACDGPSPWPYTFGALVRTDEGSGGAVLRLGFLDSQGRILEIVSTVAASHGQFDHLFVTAVPPTDAVVVSTDVASNGPGRIKATAQKAFLLHHPVFFPRAEAQRLGYTQ